MGTRELQLAALTMELYLIRSCVGLTGGSCSPAEVTVHMHETF